MPEKPELTKEIIAARLAHYMKTATDEQETIFEDYKEKLQEYETLRDKAFKRPCPFCRSTSTYSKKAGAVVHCRKCGQDSPVRYIAKRA